MNTTLERPPFRIFHSAEDESKQISHDSGILFEDGMLVAYTRTEEQYEEAGEEEWDYEVETKIKGAALARLRRILNLADDSVEELLDAVIALFNGPAAFNNLHKYLQHHKIHYTTETTA